MIRPGKGQRRQFSNSSQSSSLHQSEAVAEPAARERSSTEAALLWAALLIVILQVSWFVYYFQFVKLPKPVSALDAGRRGFSEENAYKHVKVLSNLGPHPVGSEALDRAIAYVLSNCEEIQAESSWDVDVEVDFFHSKAGFNHLVGGLFKGRSLVYANLKHVIVRVKPAFVPGAEQNGILVSSHIDTVISAPGAGDCSSNVAVMLELARAISHWGQGFKHSVIFLFNTGEEEGLDGAHAFITQHPWRSSIRTFIDLEAMGVGGKSSLFQGGPNKWIVEEYARVARHPAAQVVAQDVFLSGFVKSATDFQVYKEVANISGLDFAYMQNGAVYHTRNDKIQLLTPGSLQHLGDNMLALLREVAVSDDLPNLETSQAVEPKMETVYFDILGYFFITYSRQLAKQLNASFISQALLLLLMSLFQGGLDSIIAFSLTILSLVCTWVLSISTSILVGITLPYISHAAVPYIAHPWLAIGLFGAPALFGALLGHWLGFSLLKKYLFSVRQRRSEVSEKYTSQRYLSMAVWDSERWLFKAGFLQWLAILALGTWFDVLSSYVALLWLISPAIAYGLIDATFSSHKAPHELRTMTLLAALPLPLLFTGGATIHLFDVMIGNLVRFDRNPGSTPDWLGNLVVAVMAAAAVCLFLVYLLPFAHRSGGLKWILCGSATLLFLSLSMVVCGIFPPFTSHVGRAIDVVHVVEVGTVDGLQSPLSSYVALSSHTPGKLTQESTFLKDKPFSCGKMDGLDMVTHTIKYGCKIPADEEEDNKTYFSHFPKVFVSDDKVVDDERVTSVFIYTAEAHRWVLAISTTEASSFKLETAEEDTAGTKEILASRKSVDSIHGWHLVQFVTDQTGPSYFELTLFRSAQERRDISEGNLLLKLRTDVSITTPKVEKVLQNLPDWVVLFGKSTSPYPLSYLITVPLNIPIGSSK